MGKEKTEVYHANCQGLFLLQQGPLSTIRFFFHSSVMAFLQSLCRGHQPYRTGCVCTMDEIILSSSTIYAHTCYGVTFFCFRPAIVWFGLLYESCCRILSRKRLFGRRYC